MNTRGATGRPISASTRPPGWSSRPARTARPGDTARPPNSGITYRRNLLATLREREIARVGGERAAKKGVPFRTASDGEAVTGKFAGAVQLSSGKFAMGEQSQEFTLAPWRPIFDSQLGREVMGAVQGGSVLWQLRRQRGLALQA